MTICVCRLDRRRCRPRVWADTPTTPCRVPSPGLSPAAGPVDDCCSVATTTVRSPVTRCRTPRIVRRSVTPLPSNHRCQKPCHTVEDAPDSQTASGWSVTPLPSNHRCQKPCHTVEDAPDSQTVSDAPPLLYHPPLSEALSHGGGRPRVRRLVTPLPSPPTTAQWGKSRSSKNKCLVVTPFLGLRPNLARLKSDPLSVF